MSGKKIRKKTQYKGTFAENTPFKVYIVTSEASNWWIGPPRRRRNTTVPRTQNFCKDRKRSSLIGQLIKFHGRKSRGGTVASELCSAKTKKIDISPE